MRLLIVTGDDFGRSSSINRAIVEAHENGVLTSASLMIGADAAAEAVELARSRTSLAVGLHLAITDARPVLPPGQLDRLVDRDGRLRRDPLKTGLLLAGSRRARTQLMAELRAQFERFAATGLHLSHVDGHMHLHVHPAIFRQVVAMTREFGAAGLRLPGEPLKPVVRSFGRGSLARVSRTTALSILSRRARRLVRKSGLNFVDCCFGISRTGKMNSDYVVQVLENLRDCRCELVFHPAYAERLDRLGPNRGDFEALLNPEVRSAIERNGWRLSNYRLLDSEPPP